MERKGFTVWFTGPPAAGKTTLARLLEQALQERGLKAEVLDGEALRETLCRGLGYSKEDRDTHVRRLGLVCKLLSRNGVVAIAAAVAPYAAVRAENRALIGDYLEVHLDCPIEQLRARDPKGLYDKALRGEITHFTGVDDPYERPTHPDLRLQTDAEPPTASLRAVLDLLGARGYLPTR